MVSAVKIGGRRLHELARAGLEVERARGRCTSIASTVEPTDDPLVWRVAVECSSGTYMRTLAADLGTALGGGAHLRTLRRTAVGAFGLDEAVPIEAVTVEGLLPPAEALAPPRRRHRRRRARRPPSATARSSPPPSSGSPAPGPWRRARRRRRTARRLRAPQGRLREAGSGPRPGLTPRNAAMAAEVGASCRWPCAGASAASTSRRRRHGSWRARPARRRSIRSRWSSHDQLGRIVAFRGTGSGALVTVRRGRPALRGMGAPDRQCCARPSRGACADMWRVRTARRREFAHAVHTNAGAAGGPASVLRRRPPLSRGESRSSAP